MTLKMGGYICDDCRKVIIHPTEDAYGWVSNILQNTELVIRIYCPNCGRQKGERPFVGDDDHLKEEGEVNGY